VKRLKEKGKAVLTQPVLEEGRIAELAGPFMTNNFKPRVLRKTVQ
jgi:hypothetical protein